MQLCGRSNCGASVKKRLNYENLTVPAQSKVFATLSSLTQVSSAAPYNCVQVEKTSHWGESLPHKENNVKGTILVDQYSSNSILCCLLLAHL